MLLLAVPGWCDRWRLSPDVQRHAHCEVRLEPVGIPRLDADASMGSRVGGDLAVPVDSVIVAERPILVHAPAGSRIALPSQLMPLEPEVALRGVGDGGVAGRGLV